MKKFPFERIPAPLLAWYKINKRELAWRSEPTPYHIWVSEIMLQQTRVEAVKAYYDRFINALPTVQDLACCEEEKLLKLWEGLGYYSRVRNMQKTARLIVTDFQGTFPSNPQTLARLPGIGAYTAGAIASIAFGQPVSAVDGNVLRVASRLEENPTPISDLAYRKRLQTELSSVYPETAEDCSAFTQSLFELGALVCKPQTPDCGVCPLSHMCRAYQGGTQTLFPVIPQKREKRHENVYVFLIETPEGVCIRRREAGVLRGMNEFPSYVYNGESAEQVLDEWGVDVLCEVKRGQYKHVFTHIVWHITCIWVKAQSAPFDTYSLEEIEETVSLPTAFKQCLGMLGNERI